MFLKMRQNNSGGYYLINEKLGVGEIIFIESQSIAEAEQQFKKIAESYGDGFYQYCNCCGERWSDFEWKDDSDLLEEIELHAGFVHYKDGRIEKLN